ncbi:MAG: glutathione S-transferase, partial [Myxococcaceae bacterium]|nr:glutathione S-transferase [Myxococcaceae bacterium]
YKRLAGLGAPDAAAVDRGTRDFHQLASVLDARLDGRPFLVGERITLADLSIAAGLTFATPAAIPVGGYEHVQRWFASIETLGAWKETAPPALG